MRVKKLILHIGRHKSGTSSIQKSLSSSSSLLSSIGILYPLFGRNGAFGIAHHRLAKMLNPQLSHRPDIKAIVNEISNEVKNSEETILLSSEAFQQISNFTYIREFLAELNPHSILIICYFREHLDYAVSSYRQFIHANSNYINFLDYNKRFGSMENFISNWSSIGKFKMKWFSSNSLLDNDIISDFLNVAKINLRLTSFRMNPSLGGDLFFLKLLFNFKGKPLLDYRTLSSLCTVKSEWNMPFKINSELAIKIRERSDYNQSLISNLGKTTLKCFDKYPSLPTSNIKDDLINYLSKNYNTTFNQKLSDNILNGKYSHLLF